MADVKKFLDIEGLKFLWSKINMQDYPNNETLITVINAIDETKADKEIVNAHIANTEVHLSAGERELWNSKQDKIIGNPGDIVMIDQNSNAVGMTPEALTLTDVITGQKYSIQIQNGEIITFINTSLLGKGITHNFVLGE